MDGMQKLKACCDSLKSKKVALTTARSRGERCTSVPSNLSIKESPEGFVLAGTRAHCCGATPRRASRTWAAGLLLLEAACSFLPSCCPRRARWPQCGWLGTWTSGSRRPKSLTPAFLTLLVRQLCIVMRRSCQEWLASCAVAVFKCAPCLCQDMLCCVCRQHHQL